MNGSPLPTSDSTPTRAPAGAMVPAPVSSTRPSFTKRRGMRNVFTESVGMTTRASRMAVTVPSAWKPTKRTRTRSPWRSRSAWMVKVAAKCTTYALATGSKRVCSSCATTSVLVLPTICSTNRLTLAMLSATFMSVSSESTTPGGSRVLTVARHRQHRPHPQSTRLHACLRTIPRLQRAFDANAANVRFTPSRTSTCGV